MITWWINENTYVFIACEFMFPCILTGFWLQKSPGQVDRGGTISPVVNKNMKHGGG